MGDCRPCFLNTKVDLDIFMFSRNCLYIYNTFLMCIDIYFEDLKPLRLMSDGYINNCKVFT